MIASLEDGGPAALAGLLVGDILLEIIDSAAGAGHAVTGPDSLRDALSDLSDKTVKVVLIRGGARQEVDVKVGSRS